MHEFSDLQLLKVG